MTSRFPLYAWRGLHHYLAREGGLLKSTRGFRASATPWKQRAIPAAYYRGGTSRAIMFHEKDLPSRREDWGKIFLSVIGSPDPIGRQLDGMGGGVSSLSKVCIIGSPSKRDDADVDYTFVALGVKNSDVDFSSNCGNMTSAIGPFAYDEGLVGQHISDGAVSVQIHNTNSGKIIVSRFDVADGEAIAAGDFVIDGVSGTAGRIQLNFLSPAGSKTGRLLPTGNVVDIIDGIEASCIDVANPCVFVRAEDMGMDMTTGLLPEESTSHPTLLTRLDSIRRQASAMMGVSQSPETAPGSIPKIVMVSRPCQHKTLSGVELAAEEVDLVVRALSVGQPHLAVPITVALCTAAGAEIPGTLVANMVSHSRADKHGITIGHASGKLVVGASFNKTNGELEHATVYRTARRLMKGLVYCKE